MGAYSLHHIHQSPEMRCPVVAEKIDLVIICKDLEVCMILTIPLINDVFHNPFFRTHTQGYRPLIGLVTRIALDLDQSPSHTLLRRHY